MVKSCGRWTVLVTALPLRYLLRYTMQSKVADCGEETRHCCWAPALAFHLAHWRLYIETRTMNVAEPILETLARHPARLAVREGNNRSISYGELHKAILVVAKYLAVEGLTPGDRIAIQTPNGADFAAAAIGVLLAGGVPVFGEVGLGDVAYLAQMRAARPRWVLCHPSLIRANSIPGLRQILKRREMDIPPLLPSDFGIRMLDFSLAKVDHWAQRGINTAQVPVSRGAYDEAVLVFTGGTLAAPKGVRLSHNAVAEYLDTIAIVIEDLKVECLLADTPQQLLYALRLGRSACTTRGRKERRARQILDLVRSGIVDAYFGSPYIWVTMMKLARDHRGPTRLPATLRTIILGSAPVTPRFLGILSSFIHPETKVLCLYGLTEAGPVCIADAAEKTAWNADGDWVGRPVARVRLAIRPLESRQAALAPGISADSEQIGEVVVHSPALFSGYLNEPERVPADALHTGDLGYLHHAKHGEELVLVGP